MRALIVCLLAGGLLLGGCDRRSAPTPQATDNQTQAAATSPDEAAAPAAQPSGTVDRSHRGEAALTKAFQDPDGKPVTLAAFKGKPLLLNLWATWCGPCVKEMPTLDKLAQGQAGKLQVIPVSQDMQPEKVAPFFARTGVTSLKPYRDPAMGLSLALGANLPTTILYDSTGHELWRVTGDLDWTGAKAAALLAEAK